MDYFALKLITIKLVTQGVCGITDIWLSNVEGFPKDNLIERNHLFICISLKWRNGH